MVFKKVIVFFLPVFVSVFVLFSGCNVVGVNDDYNLNNIEDDGQQIEIMRNQGSCG